MISDVLMNIFAVAVLIGTSFASAMLLGAAFYDFRATFHEKKRQARPNRRVYRYRPFLSIVIPAHNEELVIESSLRGIMRSSYRKYEIIVVDDCSADNTRAIVRRLIKEFPNRNIRLVALRKNRGRGSAINSGIARANGELIMALDADCIPAKYALRNMVRHFANPKVMAAAANVRIMEDGTTLGMLQEFEYLVSFRSKKFNTISNSEYIIGGAGATYRAAIFKDLKGFDPSMKTEDIELSFRMLRHYGNKKIKLLYASDAVVYTQAVPTIKSLFSQRYRWKFGSLQALYANRTLFMNPRLRYSKFLTFVRLPLIYWFELMLLLEPVYFVFFLYYAIKFNNPALFASAMAMFTALLLIAIWNDEHLTNKKRLQMSFYAPMMYFVFFVMTIVQIAAAIKCLLNIRGIMGKNKISGAYISPERRSLMVEG